MTGNRALLSLAELKLTRVTGPLEEFDPGDAGIIGCVLIGEAGPGLFEHNAGIRAGLSFAQRERFAQWACERILRFIEHGPEPDGWHKRARDSKWQLLAREVMLPDPR